MSKNKGAPKHQNSSAWIPDKGVKKKEKELGGKAHPYPAITGVCLRCKEKIQWRRKYGKYKALTEPAKCHQCGKRNVRQAYHALCTACAHEKNACAKCCHPADAIVGRNAEEEENERKQLESALNNLRERDRRTLLRAMKKGTKVDTKSLSTSNLDDAESSHSDEESGSELSDIERDLQEVKIQQDTP